MAVERSERRNLFKPKTPEQRSQQNWWCFISSYSAHNHECVFEGEGAASVSSGAFSSASDELRAEFPPSTSDMDSVTPKDDSVYMRFSNAEEIKPLRVQLEVPAQPAQPLLLRAGGLALPLTAPRSSPCCTAPTSTSSSTVSRDSGEQIRAPNLAESRFFPLLQTG